MTLENSSPLLFFQVFVGFKQVAEFLPITKGIKLLSIDIIADRLHHPMQNQFYIWIMTLVTYWLWVIRGFCFFYLNTQMTQKYYDLDFYVWTKIHGWNGQWYSNHRTSIIFFPGNFEIMHRRFFYEVRLLMVWEKL